MKALLIGNEPPYTLGYTYVKEPPYDTVVIGSLTLAQVLCFSCQEALTALAEGKPVVLYTPGLPEVPHNRALAATVASRQREMKNWGIRFTDGGGRRLVTAQEARTMRLQGLRPSPDAVLTPLAREILEGLE